MARKPVKRVGKFCLSNDGATLIEFAFVAPVLLLLILGILEFGLIMFITSVVEGVTSMTARAGKTGHTDSGNRAAELKDMFYARTGGILDIDKLHICSNPTASGDFTTATFDPPCLQDNNPEPGDTAWIDPINAGSGSQVVLYTVTYEWNVLIPLLWPFFPADANRNMKSGVAYISSIATVKNEAF